MSLAIRSRGLWLDRLVDTLFESRPLGVLIALSVFVGLANAVTTMPLPVILGIGDFWTWFPRGSVPGGMNDMAQALTGYRYLAASPWMLPFLQATNLVPPAGTNAFLMDAVPLAALTGRLTEAIAGHPVNLLGAFMFLCLVLPGVAMTLLFWRAGARGMIASIVATCLMDWNPVMLFEWGHISLTPHYLIILALALCIPGRRPGGDWRISVAWLVLLAAAMLIHIYLFFMIGALWAAYIGQAWLDRGVTRLRLALEAALTVAPILLLGVAAGIVSSRISDGQTMQFGIFSLNLASPFVPQYSGAIPPLRDHLEGAAYQTMGYPGLGVQIVVAAAVLWCLFGRSSAPILVWARRHAVMIVVLSFCFLFALSNRITFGSYTLLDIPLPQKLLYALGVFRASGRFIWPVIYAAAAAGALSLMRQSRRGLALAILLPACVLQIVDASPIRGAVAASMAGPAPASFDRQVAAEMIAGAQAVSIFPSPGCMEQPEHITDIDAPFVRLLTAHVQLELLASVRTLPLNSVYTSRGAADCQAEARTLRADLRPNEAYFYLTGFTPDPRQLGGQAVRDVCTPIGWMLACKVP